MEFLETFIRQESLILIPVLYLIALFMRQTPNFPFWLIPWVQVIIGVTFSLLYYGVDITSVVQGILTAGAAVLLKDVIHIPLEGEDSNGEK